MDSLVIALITVPVGLYILTVIGEHYVSNPRMFRWGMVAISAVIALVLFNVSDSDLANGISAGLLAYVTIYVLGPFIGLYRPGVKEGLEYPDGGSKAKKAKKSKKKK